MPAASFGEKIPAYRPPMTSTKSSTTPHTFDRARAFSIMEQGSPAGPSEGVRRTRRPMVAMYRSIWSMPGMNPAMNSAPMDCWVMMP